MPVRRQTPPNVVRVIWDGIISLSVQRQTSNLVRLARYTKQELDMEIDETEKMIDFCMKDNLIKPFFTAGSRGLRKGVGQKAYKLPPEFLKIPSNDTHDWYCFECHIGGNVICCEGCMRVFHPECIIIYTSAFKSNTIADNISIADSIIGEDQRNNIILNENSMDITNSITSKEDPLAPNSIDIDTNGVDDNIADVYIDQELSSDSDMKAMDNNVIDLTQANILRMKNILSAKLKEHLDKKPNVKNENSSDTSSNIKKELLDSKDNIMNQTKDEASDCIILNSNFKSITNITSNESSIFKLEEDNNEDTGLDPDRYCSVCRMLDHEEKYEKLVDVTVQEINYLLGFTYERIKVWLPDDSFSTVIAQSTSSLEPGEFQWRISYMIKQKMFKSTIRSKLLNEQYGSFGQFHADVLDLQHAVAVMHGTSSDESQAARYMVVDCQYDLVEVKQCRDCYRHSNEKSGPFWFAKPCIPRHELVYAKQIGYSYWPAKIIKLTKGGQYDVRFFGHQHLRAVVDSRSVKPIDTDISSLKIVKRTGAFKKALEELYRHQQLLTYPPGAFSYQMERIQNINDDALNTALSENIMPSSSTPSQPKRNTKKNKNPIKTNKVNVRSRNVKKRVITNKNKSKIMLLKKNKEDCLTSFSESLCIQKKRTENRDINNDISIYNFNDDDDILNVSGSSVENIETDNQNVLPNTRSNQSLSRAIDRMRNNKQQSRDNVKRSHMKQPSRRAAQRRTKKRKNKKPEILSRHSTPNSSIDESDTVTSPPCIFNQESSRCSQEALISSTQDINSPMNLTSMSPINLEPSTSAPPKLSGRLAYSDAINKFKNTMNETTDIKLIKQTALDTLQRETERWQHKVRNMVDDHNVMISEIKKKQWCYYCEQEAIYHCCWNTAYCSTICQQQHWQTEHKRICRRKR